MDLRGKFRKIRQIEATIEQPFVVVSSLETVDGGRDGVLTQVSRYQAAALMVEGRAKMATAEESEAFHKKAELGRQQFVETQASRVQISVLSEQDIKSIKAALRPQKGPRRWPTVSLTVPWWMRKNWRGMNLRCWM